MAILLICCFLYYLELLPFFYFKELFIFSLLIAYTPKAMGLILNWINKKFGKRNIIAINTHFHIDRLGGNEALINAGIPIYCSDLTIKEINEKGQKSINLMLSWIKDENIKYYYQNFTTVRKFLK
jgi:hypothetical protein